MKVEEADPDRYGGALATTAAVTVGASLFGLGEQRGVFVCTPHTWFSRRMKISLLPSTSVPGTCTTKQQS